MPKIIVAKREDIPAGLEPDDIKEVDGKFEVNVVSHKTHAGFRDTNIAALRERDELKTKLAAYVDKVGEDLGAFGADLEELRAVRQQVKDGKLKTTKDIESAVEERLKQSKEALDARLAKVESDKAVSDARGDKFEGLYKRGTRNQAVTNAVLASDSGVNPAALPDILARAERVFQVEEDGSLVAKDAEDKIIYGEDARSSLSPKEWLTKLLAEAPYLGLQNTGGGAGSGSSGKQTYGMSKEAFDKLPPDQRVTLARKHAK